MTQPSVVDVIGLFVFISTIIFSADVAAIIGPYVAIVVAAAIGASFSLARRERSKRTAAIWYFGRICGLAVLIAGALAALVSQFHPALTERALLAPVAFAIGLVGDDWPGVGRWVVQFVLRKRGGGGEQ